MNDTTVIVVGDSDHVPGVGELFFDKSPPIFSHCHLELARTTRHTADGLRVSIVTHGMGTGSMEVINNEIIMLKCIDVETHTPKAPPAGFVNIVRVGTSGAIHSKGDWDVLHPSARYWPRQHEALLRCACH